MTPYLLRRRTDPPVDRWELYDRDTGQYLGSVNRRRDERWAARLPNGRPLDNPLSLRGTYPTRQRATDSLYDHAQKVTP